MSTAEMDAVRITREMVAAQMAQEAAEWVVEDGTYEATVSKYDAVEEDKRWESEKNAGSIPYSVDFQAYDTPTKASKVQGIRLQTKPVQTEWGIDKGFNMAKVLIGLADAYDHETTAQQLEAALDWAKTNRIKIRVGNNKPKDATKLAEFVAADKKVRNRVYAIKKV